MSPDEPLPAALSGYIEKSGVALAISRADRDAPLILVNGAFCDLTGYARDEVIGRNCRFLQGSDTAEADRMALHDFVNGLGADNGRFPILNYRKDGSEFLNLVFMTRLRDEGGETQFVLASQFDMTSAMNRARIAENDAALKSALTDMEQIGREFGFAMIGSAQLLADSVALMARMTLEDRREK
ncbi:MAG: PAS domain-containing protein [Pseudooceanicola sp.]